MPFSLFLSKNIVFMDRSYSAGVVLYSLQLLRWRVYVANLDVQSVELELNKERIRHLNIPLHDLAYICKGLLDFLRYGTLSPRKFCVMLRYLHNENILNRYTFTTNEWNSIISIYPRSKVVLHVLRNSTRMERV